MLEKEKKPKTAPRKGFLGVLHSASDWNLKFDLDGMLVVPVFLAVSTLRPDLLLFSRSTKKVIIIELTCPCEENMNQWHRNTIPCVVQLDLMAGLFISML